MALDIEWYIEDAVLLQTYSGGLDLDSITDGFERTVQWMNASPAPEIHIIADHTHLTHVSAPFARLQTLFVKLFDQPKQGHFVVCGSESPLLPFLMHCQMRMGGVSLHLTSTHDSALRYLEEMADLRSPAILRR